jgi:hypothetical protein
MNPQSFNKYTYCFNNPLNRNDPTGHWPNWGAIWNGFIVRLSDIFLHPREWVAESVTNSLLAPSGVSVDYTPSLVDISGAPPSYRVAYEYGSTLADAATITGITAGIGYAAAGPNVNAETIKGYRYVSDREMDYILENGEIPNVNVRGLPKEISFTDQIYTDVKDATENLRVGARDPNGAQPPPGYGVSFTISSSDATYLGMTGEHTNY